MSEEIQERVRQLERWRTAQELRVAVEQEQRKHLDERFDKIDKDLDDIKGAFWKVIWTFFAVFVAGFAGFIMSGGLVVKDVL